MANLTLWETVKELKSPKYKWVDLTHELSPETPHWYGFSPLESKLLFDYVEGTPDDMMAPMRCFQISVASSAVSPSQVMRLQPALTASMFRAKSSWLYEEMA